MDYQEINLNIRYDAPNEIWDKMPLIYKQLDGWLGFGTGNENGEIGIPYWFNFNESERHICASVEPSGLFFSGFLERTEWEAWIKKIKEIATIELGFKVSETELEQY